MGMIPILAQMLGFIIGFYIFYAIIAAIFKHEIGLIVSSGGMLLSIFMTHNNYINFLSTIVAICILFTIPQIQIKSKNNKEWQKKKELKARLKQQALENKDATITQISKVSQPDTNNEEEQKTQKNQKRYCPACDCEIKKTSKICPNCGEDITKVSEQKTLVLNKNIQDYSKKIRVFEKMFLISLIAFVSLSIILPISLSIHHDIKLDFNNAQEKTALGVLDKYEEVYIIEQTTSTKETQYVIYQKQDNKLLCYIFSSNHASKYGAGFATKTEILEHFENIIFEEPSIGYTSPLLLATTIILLSAGVACITCGIVLFKTNENKLINIMLKSKGTNLEIKDKIVAIINKHNQGLITDADYRDYKKTLLNQIIHNKLKFLL